MALDVQVKHIKMMRSVNPTMRKLPEESFTEWQDKARAKLKELLGLPMETVKKLAGELPLRLLSLTDKQMERLLETYGGYIRCTIPADTYSGQTEAVDTVGVRAVLLADNDLEEETVKKVLSVLMSKAEELKTASGTETALSLETCGEGIAIPYHPGAAAYYREKGITVEMEAAG